MSIKLRERAGVVVMRAGRAFGIGTIRIPFGVLRTDDEASGTHQGR